MKKLLRRIACKLNLNHRVTEEWTPLESSGLGGPLGAAMWGCVTVQGKVNSFRCVDCGTVIAPFEQSRVQYQVVDTKNVPESEITAAMEGEQ